MCVQHVWRNVSRNVTCVCAHNCRCVTRNYAELCQSTLQECYTKPLLMIFMMLNLIQGSYVGISKYQCCVDSSRMHICEKTSPFYSDSDSLLPVFFNFDSDSHQKRLTSSTRARVTHLSPSQKRQMIRVTLFTLTFDSILLKMKFMFWKINKCVNNAMDY